MQLRKANLYRKPISRVQRAASTKPLRVVRQKTIPKLKEVAKSPPTPVKMVVIKKREPLRKVAIVPELKIVSVSNKRRARIANRKIKKAARVQKRTDRKDNRVGRKMAKKGQKYDFKLARNSSNNLRKTSVNKDKFEAHKVAYANGIDVSAGGQIKKGLFGVAAASGAILGGAALNNLAKQATAITALKRVEKGALPSSPVEMAKIEKVNSAELLGDYTKPITDLSGISSPLVQDTKKGFLSGLGKTVNGLFASANPESENQKFEKIMFKEKLDEAGLFAKANPAIIAVGVGVLALGAWVYKKFSTKKYF